MEQSEKQSKYDQIMKKAEELGFKTIKCDHGLEDCLYRDEIHDALV